MGQPESFNDKKHPSYVCKLQNARYELKQAPRQCNAKIKVSLCDELGFFACASDLCLYVKRFETEFRMLTLYVDDFLLAAKHLQ